MYFLRPNSTNISHVPLFKYPKDVGFLELQPLKHLKNELSARGKQFLRLRGSHYLQYIGDIIQHDTEVHMRLGPDDDAKLLHFPVLAPRYS